MAGAAKAGQTILPPRGALAVCALVALCAGCRKPAPPPPPAPLAAAVVDGAPILLSTLQHELDRARRAPAQIPVQEGTAAGDSDSADAGTPDVKTLARALLGPLVERQILAARAKAAKLAVSDAEVQRATETLADDVRAAGQGFPEHLRADGQTPEQLSDETRERLLAEKYVSQELKVAQPTAAEVKQYFEAHRAEFERPEAVHALQLVVASAAEAKNLLDQLRKGALFDEVARAHSLSPDAQRGGDLGFFARGTMPPVFDETCFALKAGQLSGVVQSRYGFHLFKLVERRAAKGLTLAEAKADIERRLFAERRIAAERALLASLREKATVQVNDAALAQLR